MLRKNKVMFKAKVYQIKETLFLLY